MATSLFDLLKRVDSSDFEFILLGYADFLESQSNSADSKSLLVSQFKIFSKYLLSQSFNLTEVAEDHPLVEIYELLQAKHQYYTGRLYTKNPFDQYLSLLCIEHLGRDMNSFWDEVLSLPIHDEIATPYDFHNLPTIAKCLYGLEDISLLQNIGTSIADQASKNPSKAQSQIAACFDILNSFFIDDHFVSIWDREEVNTDEIFTYTIESGEEIEVDNSEEIIEQYKIGTIKLFALKLVKYSSNNANLFKSSLLDSLTQEDYIAIRNRQQTRGKRQKNKIISLIIYLHLRSIIENSRLLTHENIEALLLSLTETISTRELSYTVAFNNLHPNAPLDQKVIISSLDILLKISRENRDLDKRFKKTYLKAKENGGCFGLYYENYFHPISFKMLKAYSTPNLLDSIQELFEKFMSTGPEFLS